VEQLERMATMNSTTYALVAGPTWSEDRAISPTYFGQRKCKFNKITCLVKIVERVVIEETKEMSQINLKELFSLAISYSVASISIYEDRFHFILVPLKASLPGVQDSLLQDIESLNSKYLKKRTDEADRVKYLYDDYPLSSVTLRFAVRYKDLRRDIDELTLKNLRDLKIS
jgi:hypothetical protein